MNSHAKYHYTPSLKATQFSKDSFTKEENVFVHTCHEPGNFCSQIGSNQLPILNHPFCFNQDGNLISQTTLNCSNESLNLFTNLNPSVENSFLQFNSQLKGQKMGDHFGEATNSSYRNNNVLQSGFFSGKGQSFENFSNFISCKEKFNDSFLNFCLEQQVAQKTQAQDYQEDENLRKLVNFYFTSSMAAI